MLCSKGGYQGCPTPVWIAMPRFLGSQETCTAAMDQEKKMKKHMHNIKLWNQQRGLAIWNLMATKERELRHVRQFTIKDVIVCVLVIVVLIQSYLLYKE